MDNQQEYAIIKTVIISILVLISVFLFFLYKVEACSSKPENCHDEFHDVQYTSKCDPGAFMEPVNTPKPGFICHCKNLTIDGGK